MAAINRLADKGMFFWDYGNAFLLEAQRAGKYILELLDENKDNSECILPVVCFGKIGLPMCYANSLVSLSRSLRPHTFSVAEVEPSWEPRFYIL